MNTPPSVSQPSPALEVGQQFDGLEVVSVLGHGGMGTVFRGIDMALGRPVALKVAHPQPGYEHQERLLHEGRILAGVRHPNVLGIHRVAQTDEQLPVLVLELVDGVALNAILQPLDWERVVAIGIGVADGLHALHRAGVIHRDVKPSNIMLSRTGEVRLIDAGLAKDLAGAYEPGGDTSTLSPACYGEADAGIIMGTPRYLAPEILLGASSSLRSDVYALGLVLLELVSGQTGASRPQDVAALDIPGALAEVIQTCLEAEPALRYRSAGEVLRALRALATSATSSDEAPLAELVHLPACQPASDRDAFATTLIFAKDEQIRPAA